MVEFVALLAFAAAPPAVDSLPMPGLEARSIGPAVMGGRIPAVAVVESQPEIQYVGSAGGGVWKTTDDGRSWACVFAGRPNGSIGAVAVAPSHPEIVYVGTGEGNPRNSVSWGNGVFVSRDGGRNWHHAGLAETHHIGRIAIHPRDPNTAYVAALGHLWGANAARGLFVTRDGGASWEHALKLDADTGCVDVVIPRDEPQTVYAAAYRVRRGPFSGGNPQTQFGPLAGIYRSLDAGRTWKRLRRGLPTNLLGRIGLAVARQDARLLYAVVQTERTDIRTIPGQAPGLGPVETGGIFVSRDRGETWSKVNDLCPRPFYFSKIRIDPLDEQRLYVLGVPMYVSSDGGRTFRSDGAREVHVDHHDLWINPEDPRHLVLGNDGGLYHSRNRGQSWTHIANLPISQFYGIAVDRRSPYHIFGGLQDNGTWGGPSATLSTASIRNEDWQRMLGMDGFQCQVPSDSNDLLYAEGQYGRLHRINIPLKRAVSIRPYSTRRSSPTYRFNWSSPLVLSAHDSRTLYYGGNHLFKSSDQGTTWRILSPDLTRGESGCAVTDHTLTAIGESPLRSGLLMVGSDDGRLHITRDDGKTWQELSDRLPGVPADGSFTRITWSPHAVNTVWVSLSRHRRDDRRPYLFRSDDAGKTWRSSHSNLPLDGPIHVVRADQRNPELLLVGTEFGLFVSLDAGGDWQRLRAGLPPCAVQDLAIHPRDRELVIATHGRGIYVLDLAPLQELTRAVKTRAVHLFPAREARFLPHTGLPLPSHQSYHGKNPPQGAILHYWLAKSMGRGVTLEIVALSGKSVARVAGSGGAGVQRVVWNLRDHEGNPVLPGEYEVRLRAGSEVVATRLRVRGNEPRKPLATPE